jgi:hypothetical protein
MKRCSLTRLSAVERTVQGCNQRSPNTRNRTRDHSIPASCDLQSNALPTELCSVAYAPRTPKLGPHCRDHDTNMQQKRQRGDSNPRGQSPSDFESDSLTTRTHCLWKDADFCQEGPHQNWTLGDAPQQAKPRPPSTATSETTSIL